ncbi:MAG TPA: MBL fold metallo-hydrolase [Blastocatellia bacterium]|nr:MBL fold metallo-hydrolase [Blastocatellia bacterium]HMX26028.1 MBL fold metallo-hydrolase [Blastocatellia bacterium]HMY73185.1 MBL fold metallo-hydrolase [Blastocatellia bacterium]HMZ21480.1 MBL fold metallo-hydrolase [Blastocatellia bacterium]HNG28923.1 MBL fold metallo-hydrolase [Blastocatellia bacterium]
MRIEKLVIPTPFPVGPINIYLIVEDPLTLVDTGPKTDEALAALRGQLRELGFAAKDLKRIVLTHTHEDHCGLAATLQRESGAKVFVHEWEFQSISQRSKEASGQTRVNRGLLRRAGVPAEELERIAGRYELIHHYADAVEDVEAYRDEQEFVFAAGSLRAIHTPGHTPGSCCLLREANRLLLAGDTVLKTISPNPVLNADPIDPRQRFSSLGEYLVSLARIRSLAPTLIKTAHGSDVTDYEEHFHRSIRQIQDRQNKVLSLVPQPGITAWEMSKLLFPKVDNLNRFLAVSEASAHLDLAVAEEKLRIERQGEVEIFLRGR